VADAVEALRQDMDEESADELFGSKCHDLLAVATLGAIILPSKGDAVLVGRDQTAIRDGDTVGVASGRPARPVARRTGAWHRPPIRLGVAVPDTPRMSARWREPVCTENPIRVDEVMESPKLAE
jgi:hypothetical protein